MENTLNRYQSPVVLFAYNRPYHTRMTLESLGNCGGAKESALFIFCDGPKDNKEVASVEEVRKLVKSKKWCKTVEVIERDHNLGLSRSITTGVSEIISQYGRGIFLEDDLVLASQFLDYMNEALEIYQDVPQVMHIAGFMFPIKGNIPDTFLYRGTSCWGWATWGRAWDKFESDAGDLLVRLRNRKAVRSFDIDGTMPYYKMLQKQARGKIDSWDIRWYATVFLRGGLCLHPGRSLVQNIGHDGSGTHGDMTDIYNVRLDNNRISTYPKEIREDQRITEMIAKYFRECKRPFLLRLLNKARQAWR